MVKKDTVKCPGHVAGTTSQTDSENTYKATCNSRAVEGSVQFSNPNVARHPHHRAVSETMDIPASYCTVQGHDREVSRSDVCQIRGNSAKIISSILLTFRVGNGMSGT